MVTNKKNQYIAANIQFMLHGADHSGCIEHFINETKTSIVHTIKIIGIIYKNTSLKKYRQFLFVVSFILLVFYEVNKYYNYIAKVFNNNNKPRR